MSLLPSRSGTQELQVDQSHLGFWGGNEAANPRNYLKTHERQENDRKQSAWIHQEEIMPDQPDKLL